MFAGAEMSDEKASTASPKKCQACASSIDAEAFLCPVCKSYQDWRRFMGVSTPVLGLLVALVSVASFFVSRIESFREAEAALRSNLVVRGFSWWRGEDQTTISRFSVFLANLGKAPTLVEDYSVCLNPRVACPYRMVRFQS
jgi:hypothetical protein